MAKQSKTLAGLFSTLKDNMALTADVIGQQLLPYLKPIIEDLIKITSGIQ
jgi:hypothetical protein